MIDIDAIAKIESDNNPEAFNAKSGAIGLCQITRQCLEDFNKYSGEKLVHEEVLYVSAVNRFVANWYLNTRIPALLGSFGLPVTVDNILTVYNWGIGNFAKLCRKERYKSLPEETSAYLKKYKALTKCSGA